MGSGIGRLELHQGAPLLHALPDSISHRLDDARLRRADRVLHFHRFDDEQWLAGLDRLAIGGEYAHDDTRKDRGEAARGGLIRKARLIGRGALEHLMLIATPHVGQCQSEFSQVTGDVSVAAAQEHGLNS